VRRKRFQVGGNSRAAARIKSRNGQQNRRGCVGVIVVTVVSAHDFVLVAPQSKKLEIAPKTFRPIAAQNARKRS
jgi:hypothetical protein